MDIHGNEPGLQGPKPAWPHTWGRRKKHTGSWLANMKEGHRLEDLAIDGKHYLITNLK
jgi:hypothetical protein